MQISGTHFRDTHGRTLLLRGVNLGGTSKIPTIPNGASHLPDGFFDHRGVSFVNRPFPLEEADTHFQRLRGWGFRFLRFLVTWEAIEHAAPGEYDEAYLDYLRAIIRKAGEYEISLFIDPHQDVWSRFTGGCGAPGWTFEIIGMDINRFHDTRAAIVHQTYGDPFPRMAWVSNSRRLAAATMATLFFAGNDFAPQTRVDGEPVQDYLQRHYINAMRQVAERVHDLPNVVGYDSMNEPFAGYIGHRNLNRTELPVRSDIMPTPYEAMLLGAGFPQQVTVWTLFNLGLIPSKRTWIRPSTPVWMDGYACIWKQHGVWDTDREGNPHLLQPGYFAQVNGQPVNFGRDYLRPFINRYAAGIREIHPDALIFIENEAFHQPPQWGEGDAERIVHAPHWYDVVTLHHLPVPDWMRVDSYKARPVIGARAVDRSFARQLGRYQEWSQSLLGGVPTLIGEIGIPFDLDDKRAYRTGDFRHITRLLDRCMRALEANLLNFTLWNYSPDNTNAHGDLWNGEDFSIFSRDQQTDPNDLNSGGRGLEAIVRPYARATAGEPLHMRFDRATRRFEFTFRHDPAVKAPTEIFIPALQYPDGYQIALSDGGYEIDAENQTLIYYHTPKTDIHHVLITPCKPAKKSASVRTTLLVLLVMFSLLWLLKGD